MFKVRSLSRARPLGDGCAPPAALLPPETTMVGLYPMSSSDLDIVGGSAFSLGFGRCISWGSRPSSKPFNEVAMLVPLGDSMGSDGASRLDLVSLLDGELFIVYTDTTPLDLRSPVDRKCRVGVGTNVESLFACSNKAAMALTPCPAAFAPSGCAMDTREILPRVLGELTT